MDIHGKIFNGAVLNLEQYGYIRALGLGGYFAGGSDPSFQQLHSLHLTLQRVQSSRRERKVNLLVLTEVYSVIQCKTIAVPIYQCPLI